MTIAIGLFGFGYTAQAFATRLVNHHVQVYATSRCQDTREQFSQSDIKVLDFNRQNAQLIFATCDAILITIPPNDQAGDPVLSHFQDELLANRKHINWLGYLSSTGVYGDHQGAWVTETSPPINPGPTARRRIAAESAWLTLYQQYGLPVHVFRLAGIYGPGRSSINKIQSGIDRTIYNPEQVFSRIHVDDIAEALSLSLTTPTPGEIFNLCDDLPASTCDVDAYAAALLNCLKPQPIHFEQANLSPKALEFFQGNKRVCNKKIKHHLGLKLQYPSYKEGLRSIVANTR